MWQVTGDTWHMPYDTWQVGQGEHTLKIPAPYLLQFRSEGLLKIFSQRISDWINKEINHKGVCRTAPATPAMLIIYDNKFDIIVESATDHSPPVLENPKTYTNLEIRQ